MVHDVAYSCKRIKNVVLMVTMLALSVIICIWFGHTLLYAYEGEILTKWGWWGEGGAGILLQRFWCVWTDLFPILFLPGTMTIKWLPQLCEL